MYFESRRLASSIARFICPICGSNASLICTLPIGDAMEPTAKPSRLRVFSANATCSSVSFMTLVWENPRSSIVDSPQALSTARAASRSGLISSAKALKVIIAGAMVSRPPDPGPPVLTPAPRGRSISHEAHGPAVTVLVLRTDRPRDVIVGYGQTTIPAPGRQPNVNRISRSLIAAMYVALGLAGAATAKVPQNVITTNVFNLAVATFSAEFEHVLNPKAGIYGTVRYGSFEIGDTETSWPGLSVGYHMYPGGKAPEGMFWGPLLYLNIMTATFQGVAIDYTTYTFTTTEEEVTGTFFGPMVDIGYRWNWGGFA